MENKIALGLGIVALLVSLFSLLPKQAQVLVRSLGSTQTYPLHFVQNPTSLDQIFSWGGIENAGVTWLIGAVNASSTLNVVGAATFNSTLAVTGATTFSSHLISGGGSPTVAVGGASWTAGTLAGNDTAGSVSSTPAASTPGQITVNFGSAFASAPVCNITLANSLASGASTSTGSVFVTSSVSAFSINFPVAVPPQAYRFNYHCLQ